MALISLLTWVFVPIILALIWYVTSSLRKRAEYFRKQGIPYLGAGLSRTIGFFTGSKNLVMVECDIYQEAASTSAPIVALSDIFGSNSLYIMDLDLVRNICVKDFDHFINRRPMQTQRSDKYFRRMLFAMVGEQWKGIRTKMSPSFTTGKIRRMFQIFKTSSERMDKYVQAMIPAGSKSLDINFSQIFPKYAMDVIANCAFGIDSKSWDVAPDKKSKFEEMGDMFQFKFSAKLLAKFLLSVLAPKLMDILGIDMSDAESIEYFSGVIRQVMKQRRETGQRREDFLQLMMDAQQGLLNADDESREVMNGSESTSEENFTVAESKVTFDDDDVVANAMMFLLGGFDTTQSVLVFAIYSMALEPEVQEKLYQEVKEAMGKNGGELTYEAVIEMSYLDMVLNETMRMYPPAARAERSCNQDYPVPGTDFVMKKGTIVGIPIHPMHYDPKYYPNPEKFIPERFNAQGKADRHPYAFMAFGHGPRNCIGMRFALIKVKTVIAQLVGSFQFAPCAKTTIPMEFGNGMNIKPKHGMWINVTPRR